MRKELPSGVAAEASRGPRDRRANSAGPTQAAAVICRLAVHAAASRRGTGERGRRISSDSRRGEDGGVGAGSDNARASLAGGEDDPLSWRGPASFPGGLVAAVSPLNADEGRARRGEDPRTSAGTVRPPLGGGDRLLHREQGYGYDNQPSETR
ncbi:hypothetical protein THAOC_10122 [Thalassiosira oceanica]|uniref:Uncharacterized protein n=1 Tax=Thalassiosira oceanica TaxID=159749 RepID=K0TDT1_THAOC|nr:hypothetical protein THAOC_10122 [Thalassiosira oceanica]|eukprot:EJK68677.1 hypothetical protein THAOC_10122 [Thalassiosira oceanica]